MTARGDRPGRASCAPVAASDPVRRHRRPSPCTTGSGSAARASTSAVNGPLCDAVILAAGFACLLRAWGCARERAAWLCGRRSALLAWAAAEIYWTAFLYGDPSPPYPSPADIGYLTFYPLRSWSAWRAGPDPGARTRLAPLDGRRDRGARYRRVGRGLRLRFRRRPDRSTTLEWRRPSPTRSATSLMLSLVVGVVALTRLAAGADLVAVAGRPRGAGGRRRRLHACSSSGGLPEGDWIEPIFLIARGFPGPAAWQPGAARSSLAAR